MPAQNYPFSHPAAPAGTPWTSSRSAAPAMVEYHETMYTDPSRVGPSRLDFSRQISSTFHLPSGLATGVPTFPVPNPRALVVQDQVFSSHRLPPHGGGGGVGVGGGGIGVGGGGVGGIVVAAAAAASNPFGPGKAPFRPGMQTTSAQGAWDYSGMCSPTDSMDDMIASPSLSEQSQEAPGAVMPAKAKRPGHGGKPRSQRRPSNRDEFDGPHQFLQRPPAEYMAQQERELPHLPTNLLVQEQDGILAQVHDRLSQCAFEFMAKYQFPIPLTQDMRPVERPQDREWTEWVFLLKRLTTKRRIPARVLYNGQIKQLVTILENSLEMTHTAKHQSRPLKDDRNMLQLISAGIQVAKILKDASAMEYLDMVYVTAEKQIQERAVASAARFR